MRSAPSKLLGDYRRGTPATYAVTFGAVAVATVVCLFVDRKLDVSNIIMIYLLAVSLVASRFGPGEAVAASLSSVAVFNLGFVEPRGSFAVAAPQHWITFIVMLIVALLISGLTLRLRQQAQESLERERFTSALYQLSRQLLQIRDDHALAEATAAAVRSIFCSRVDIVLLEDGRLVPITESEGPVADHNAVRTCFDQNQGNGVTGDWSERDGVLYMPIRGSQSVIGVMAVLPADKPQQQQVPILQTFANTLGLAVERLSLARASHEARVLAESERIRNSLLSSISHDLRTPLTVIAGAASCLRLGHGDSAQLVSTIYDQSLHMNIQVQNLLDMTRLNSGEVTPNLEWHLMEEVIGSAIARTSDLLEARTVKVHLSPDMPLLRIDAVLLDKVFVNLLENVVSHAPSATQIDITSDVMTATVRINVTDNGPGIPKGEEARIFERFLQPRQIRSESGFGLGLAISRAILRLHGGRIWAENAAGGGASFHLELPKPKVQPVVPNG